MTDPTANPAIPSDLEAVCRRIREKAESYEKYNFSRGRNDFLKAFFDLAQEYDNLDDFYRICVSVPLALVGVASALYLCQGQEGGLQLVCSSERGVLSEPEPACFPVQLHETPYEQNGSYVIPIFSKQSNREREHEGSERQQQQARLWDDLQGLCGGGRTLGMYEVRRKEGLSETDKFFFAKYANRIGYNLDNRLIARQNIDRLKFINTLVIDIEHNIIVPNMYFKHLFNQLKKKIGEIEALKREIVGLNEGGQSPQCSHCCARLQTLQDDLLGYYQKIVKHHANMSLFIESLFRREHFERGHLVLHPKRCLVEKEVIIPQLEHYASRLQAAQVTVERPKNMHEAEFPILVDIGLLAQVYANLFSNAAKYTREIIDHRGCPRKAMAYGSVMIDNFQRQGQKAIKFNVFTTGPNMSLEQGNRLFLEGMRGEDSLDVPGTGHGLSFIRHVIEMHGGRVGYEPTPEGNNFYFILPIPPLDYPLTLYAPVE